MSQQWRNQGSAHKWRALAQILKALPAADLKGTAFNLGSEPGKLQNWKKNKINAYQNPEGKGNNDHGYLIVYCNIPVYTAAVLLQCKQTHFAM